MFGAWSGGDRSAPDKLALSRSSRFSKRDDRAAAAAQSCAACTCRSTGSGYAFCLGRTMPFFGRRPHHRLAG
jgi:hypothetical protein